MNKVTLYACKMNLRPRVNGRPTLVIAGSSFDPAILDDHTRKVFLERGDIYPFEQESEIIDVEAEDVLDEDTPSEEDLIEEIREKALNEFGKSLKHTKLETITAAYDKLVAEVKKKDAPKGFFHMDVEDLADKSLDELDAIHVDICSANNLDSPQPFEDMEEAIAKLTGEIEG